MAISKYKIYKLSTLSFVSKKLLLIEMSNSFVKLKGDKKNS